VNEDFPLAPKVFETVVFALVRGEKMYHDIVIINEQPAVSGFAFYAAFLSMHLSDFAYYRVG
jgi:hypothetical protein